MIIVSIKKEKRINKDAVQKITQIEYKDVLLNQTFKKNLMNRSQSENNTLRSYEINKNILSCFDDKISS